MWSCRHILLFTFPLETEANLVKFNEELVGLEKELKKEQEKVEEIKGEWVYHDIVLVWLFKFEFNSAGFISLLFSTIQIARFFSSNK